MVLGGIGYLLAQPSGALAAWREILSYEFSGVPLGELQAGDLPTSSGGIKPTIVRDTGASVAVREGVHGPTAHGNRPNLQDLVYYS